MIQVNPIASSSDGNSYYLSDGSSTLLVECGVHIQKIRKGTGFALQSVSGCLISHEHQDHCKAVKDLLRLGIRCYMSSGTAEALKILDHPYTRLVSHNMTFRVGNWHVTPINVKHDAAEPLGFIIDTLTKDRLLFLTDTAYTEYTVPNMTHIMIECNYVDDSLCDIHLGQRKRLINSHMSLETVLEFLRANDLSKVVEIRLMHLSDRNSNEKQMLEEVRRETGIPVYTCDK